MQSVIFQMVYSSINYGVDVFLQKLNFFSSVTRKLLIISIFLEHVSNTMKYWNLRDNKLIFN